MSDAQDSSGIEAAAGRTERRVALLGVLADIGMGLTRRLAREAEEAEVGSLDVEAVALAFARLSKAVRQCLMLQEKLEADAVERAAVAADALKLRKVWDTPDVKAKSGGPPTQRDRLIDVMVELIDRKAGDTQGEHDAMDEEFCECLEDYGERDFKRRPLSAIIAEICNALGVEPDWDLWAEQDWAVEEAQTGRPGSPYAGRAAPEGDAGGLPPPRPSANGWDIPEHPPP